VELRLVFAGAHRIGKARLAGADDGAYPRRDGVHTITADLKTQHKAFPLRHLIVVDAKGVCDLPASKAALEKLAADPQFDSQTEVLLDLRDIECQMSTLDIYELAAFMAGPDPALPTRRKIAVLVDGRSEFDHASFLQMCTANSGIRLAAFDDYDAADDWLSADLPADPKSGND
jgi:hypothetical protein